MPSTTPETAPGSGQFHVDLISMKELTNVAVWDGTQWADAFRGGPMNTYQCDSFPEVKASKARLLIDETNGKEPSLFEFQLRHEM